MEATCGVHSAGDSEMKGVAQQDSDSEAERRKGRGRPKERPLGNAKDGEELSKEGPGRQRAQRVGKS